MKSRTLQIAVPILLVIAFTPALCRAQAEIDPDHFDSPSDVSAVAKKAASLPNPSQAYASFFLPYEVTCAGVKLTPGHYAVSIRQSGNRDVVRLTRVAAGARAHALEVMAMPRLSPERPSGLVVDQTNHRRILTAISLQQPGVTLLLQPGKAKGTSTNPEPIRISYSTNQALSPYGE
jgi:hypothetical protein